MVSSDTEGRVAGDRQRRYEGDAKNRLVRRRVLKLPKHPEWARKFGDSQPYVRTRHAACFVGLVATDQMSAVSLAV